MNILRNGKRLQRWVLSLLLPAFGMMGSPLQANPQGQAVVHGVANFQGLGTPNLTVTTGGPSTIINWQSFSIQSGESTHFQQPNAAAVTLNRVVTGNPSAIYGSLTSNGGLVLVNPNGIVVGAGGVVDVAGMLTLSTLDITNEDFLNGGSSRFSGDTTAGVTNMGYISSAQGDVFLLGGFVDNDEGQIGAMNGTVALASSGEVLIQETSNSRITVRGASDYTGTGVNNTGVIEGASVELKSHGNVYALAINNGGAVRATGASRSGGRVRLMSSGSSSNINLGQNSVVSARQNGQGGSIEVNAGAGDVTVGGTLDAAGSVRGGDISVVGNNVTQNAGAEINVTGGTNGGSATLDAAESMTVRGDIVAEGTFGSGGEVTVTGDRILMDDDQTISANGMMEGGEVRIGGDLQGNDARGLREATLVGIGEDVKISVDSELGDAGTAIVWSNNDTIFYGEITANARGIVGNGGLIEVSGKQHLVFDGTAHAHASLNGQEGVVLFDPGDVSIGAGGGTGSLVSPVTASSVSIESVNTTLQNGTDVLIVTESGSIVVERIGQGGFDNDGNAQADRHNSIMWTNSRGDLGLFASENIFVNNHIRTSGAGSISLLAGWSGAEADAFVQNFTPQAAWDAYVQLGQFGEGGGSVFVGNNDQVQHIVVGSRFGDTNIAAFDVRVYGSDTNSYNRFSQIGFNDMGNVFAPRLNNGGGIVLDMTRDGGALAGQWYLSDGLNDSEFNGGDGEGGTFNTSTSMPASGVGSPIVAVVGMHEVDMNGDGIMDGVRGITSNALDDSDGTVDGVLEDTFIPYANHFNSAGSGNWWWQQIEDAGSSETKDPLGLGGLRPEYGAGVGALSVEAKARIGFSGFEDGADINVLARGNVLVEAGSGREHVSAMIGHGGNARAAWGGANGATRETGNTSITAGNFSDAGVERQQLERRWSINGSLNDRTAHSIARLAPVYGNINVLAGLDTTIGPAVSHLNGTVSGATFGNGGNVVVRAASGDFETVNQSYNSFAQIGHGGVGQFGEFYGDIYVEAGGSVELEAGNATRSHATIGHTFNGHAYWDPPTNTDQQIRFFATVQDFDNPNARRGELFTGRVTTGFDPAGDPNASERRTLTNFALDGTGTSGPYNGAPINTTLGYNPLWYTRGDGGSNGNQGTASRGWLDLAPAGNVPVEALDGSVVNGLHGDVTVIAHNGDIEVRGYNTDITPAPGRQHRDRRFAGIGHGGSSFAFWTEGSGYNDTSAATVSDTEGREVIVWEIGDSDTYSRAYGGNDGRSERGRALMGMTLTGDIRVDAGGNITVAAGNDIYDYARIGHGGSEIADMETSSFILGDIQVTAGGDLLVQGGGIVENNARQQNERNYDLRAWAIIGHGGYRNGFLTYNGDIDVDVEGNINIKGGTRTYSGAKIGHQTHESFGQSGGTFSRTENFIRGGNEMDVVSSLTADEAKVDYSFTETTLNSTTTTMRTSNRDFTGDGAGTAIGDRHTANISVRAGGDITLDHAPEALRKVEGQLLYEEGGGTLTVNSLNEGEGARTRRSHAMIGHGDFSTKAINEYNPNANYQHKVGDIAVVSETGNINMTSGAGTARWTQIGHGVGYDRIGSTFNMDIAGNITVEATTGSILLDAFSADENDKTRAEDGDNRDASESVNGNGVPTRENPVIIGHGGLYNNYDIVVLSDGELINGIAASSDITVTAGMDLTLFGGKGVHASHAQIGHGFTSDQGNDRARRNNVATGFNGDITVTVGNDLLLKGSDNAVVGEPSTDPADAVSVAGAYAAIGNGGYQLDAPSSGDITVYVGNNATLQGQVRTEAQFDTTAGGFPTYTTQIVGPDDDSIGSVFNFAKIGHFSIENSARTSDNGDIITESEKNGDITVVVGNDLTMNAGTTPNQTAQPIWGAFVQIGNGGPGMAGDVNGDVTVLAKNNISATTGSEIPNPTAGTSRGVTLNNYVMIGNGDRIVNPGGTSGAIFRTEGIGFRTGDVTVAAGNDASFAGALVGHADPAVSSQTIIGNTKVAVSRLNPFFGGPGNLTTAVAPTDAAALNVFSGNTLQFFMPGRENNQIDNSHTRLNGTTPTSGGLTSFADDPAGGFDATLERLAGRGDEVYLTPDLWWDEDGLAAASEIDGGEAFPTDATSGQGGSVATVLSPGGAPNLDMLTAGALGSSVTTTNTTLGNFTFFYDAIELVSNTLPSPPPPPPFFASLNTSAFFFLEQFDSFLRDDRFVDDGLVGQSDFLFASLGLFETNEDETEELGSRRLENRLDNLFGPRRDSTSDEEEDEEKDEVRERGTGGVGSIGLTFYLFEPGTNQYSSYRVFGDPLGSFIPQN